MSATYHVLPESNLRLENGAQIDDLLSEAFSSGCDWLAVPQTQLGADFFVLATGLLGQTAQKFRNYNVGLAVLGDVTPHEQASTAFRDFVRETNRGDAFWFVADEHALREKLDAEN